ncbi:carbohydrate-binding protein [Massilia sp. B-10]|nr:carbohydrate-binding protein [Massilia sp. B-10]UUZ54961.1 carbohydrate-binding protein [Massilia sp. H-1]
MRVSQHLELESQLNRTIINSLIVGLLGGTLAACGGGSSSSAPQTKLLAATAVCNAAWVSTAVYTGGNVVSYNGINYTAAYWTQGDNPSTSSGAA